MSENNLIKIGYVIDTGRDCSWMYEACRRENVGERVNQLLNDCIVRKISINKEFYRYKMDDSEEGGRNE